METEVAVLGPDIWVSDRLWELVWQQVYKYLVNDLYQIH